MTAASYPVVRCDGDDCGAETSHPQAETVTQVRILRRGEGWRNRPGGRDICPDCWKDDRR
ncbi:hypothetical protein [Streptomyces sp. NPDC057250]|uniref:hypothetical protein n=1 Tax=Streptomyces sp. NPDC057250 TaxID=3346068 RepID=UPI0036362466